MNANQIESRFAEMGARVRLNLNAGITRGFRIDIQKDTNGEFFNLHAPAHPAGEMDVLVAQVEAKKRHLLLLVRQTAPRKQVDRYLCGHDEREWFVAAVPGGASSIAQAMQALKPAIVRDAEAGGYRMSSFISGVVHSPAFRMKRADAQLSTEVEQ